MGEPPIKKFEARQLSTVYEPKTIEKLATEIWFSGRIFTLIPYQKLKTQN